MSLLILTARNEPTKMGVRPFKISSSDVESRAKKIANEWTHEQRADRKVMGTKKRDWLMRLINRSLSSQE